MCQVLIAYMERARLTVERVLKGLEWVFTVRGSIPKPPTCSFIPPVTDLGSIACDRASGNVDVYPMLLSFHVLANSNPLTGVGIPHMLMSAGSVPFWSGSLVPLLHPRPQNRNYDFIAIDRKFTRGPHTIRQIIRESDPSFRGLLSP